MTTGVKTAKEKPMRKWIVYLKATYSTGGEVEIEAATKAEAKRKALEAPVDFEDPGDPDNVVVSDIEEM